MKLEKIELPDDGILTEKQIVDFIDNHDVKTLKEQHDYFKGENRFIKHRDSPDANAPDNKIAIPYARKIINTVVGYMYKPGLITYAIEDEGYKTVIDDVFYVNTEPMHTKEIGEDASIYGAGFEYHYTDAIAGQAKITDKVVPRFVKLRPWEAIPIYDYSIVPNLVCFIRYYAIGDITHIFVCYDAKWYEYQRIKQKASLELANTGFHNYSQVPLVVYRNNEEYIGDTVPIRNLIDAYDVLMSDSMNEFDRFAWAYLLLKGFSLTDEDTQTIKWKRAFENLDEKEAVTFLTKDINKEFIQFMADWIRVEIHRQSHIPDFIDFKAGNLSGAAIDRLLYDFEFLAASKEEYFKSGLYDRFKLINNILSKRDGADFDLRKIEIIMKRNTPNNEKENAEIFNMLTGHISKKTLIENYATYVKDPEAELKQLEEEQDFNLERAVNDANERFSKESEHDKETAVKT